MAVDITLEELLESGAHFGHQSRRWNPKMAPYLYTVKDGVHVFDLAKTRELLLQALEVIRQASAENKKIIIVGTKKQVHNLVEEVGKATDSFYVNQRWLGGTLTNFVQIQKSLRKMEEMKTKTANGEYSEFTKKERLLIERKIADLEKSFGGISELKGMPDLMIVIDIHHEKSAVMEAIKMGIPTVGVVDSNSDPLAVTYPVPMNDDASSSLSLVMNLFKQAILEGKTGGKKQESADKKKATKTKVAKKLKDTQEEDLS